MKKVNDLINDEVETLKDNDDKDNKLRSRNWGIILYPEDRDHVRALEYIIRFFPNYVYILHDHDYDKNGEIVKEHYHVICCFENAKSSISLQNELHIKGCYLYYIKSLSGQLRYLIHLDNDDKFQYDSCFVKGSEYLLRKFKRSIKSLRDESDDVSSIANFIYSSSTINMKILLDFVLDNDFYSAYRRNYSMFKDLVYGRLNNFYKKGVKDEVSTKS